MKTAKILLGERIKEIRKSRGLTQEKLSELSGIASKYLSKVEVGKNYPSLECLDKLGKSLGVELNDFFNYNHLQLGVTQKPKIEKMIDALNEDQRRFLIKIIKVLGE